MERHQTCVDFSFTHSEADTTIFGGYAKIKEGNDNPVIIDSEDKYVYIQAAYVAKIVNGNIYIKRKKYLVDCDNLERGHLSM